MAKSAASSAILENIKEAVESSFASTLEFSVKECLHRKRAVMVRAAYDKWAEAISRTAEPTASKDEGVWEEIVSLSALRKHVGGRFQLLRDRWVRAGLPLKEHRGTVLAASHEQTPERQAFFQWLESEGFEVSGAGETSPQGTLFCIRKQR